MSSQVTEKKTASLPVARSAWFDGILGRVIRTAARISLSPINAAITLSVRTHKSRWRKVATEIPPWDERNRMIGALIPENSAVVDLGSGAMTLRGYLKPGCLYQPCDIVPTTDEVLYCDFNSGVYPALTRSYDYVVCSGVLEYIREPVPVLTRVSTFGDTILLSYNPLRSGETKYSRLGKGWVNHFTQRELEDLFRRVNLTFQVVLTRDVNEITYELSKAAAGLRPV